MARGANQKLKLLYLTKIFMEKTDELHGLTLSEITQLLSEYGINAERKALYLDFDELRDFGLDIINEKRGKYFVYFLASRDFELAELKLLVDSVQAAKFITEKKSCSLIKKLEALVSEHEAKQLQRQVLISGRIKTMNESIFINIDCLNSAINNDHQIAFKYFQWTKNKNREFKHDGKKYIVSPWHLVWDSQNYYLIGYDSEAKKVKHYRVDKMMYLSELDEKREGKDELKTIDIAAYSNSLFGMLGGKIEHVTLECTNDMAGIIIDRFGKDVIIVNKDDEHFTVQVEVIPSKLFIGWIIGLGGNVKITAPSYLITQVRELIELQSNIYK